MSALAAVCWMIKNKDRSGWFGASDTKFIMSNWNTSTFMSWFQSKIGTKDNSFSNVYTVSGNIKEHQLSKHYAETHKEKIVLDRQIKIKKLKLLLVLEVLSLLHLKILDYSF